MPDRDGQVRRRTSQRWPHAPAKWADWTEGYSMGLAAAKVSLRHSMVDVPHLHRWSNRSARLPRRLRRTAAEVVHNLWGRGTGGQLRG